MKLLVISNTVVKIQHAKACVMRYCAKYNYRSQFFNDNLTATFHIDFLPNTSIKIAHRYKEMRRRCNLIRRFKLFEYWKSRCTAPIKYSSKSNGRGRKLTFCCRSICTYYTSFHLSY